MIQLIRPLFAALLALMLAFTGQSMAVARGASTATGAMVLCTGTGPLTVLVDRNGQPAGPAHICPDCALSLFDLAVAAPPMLAHPMGLGRAVKFEDPVSLAPAQVIPAAARGPPALA